MIDSYLYIAQSPIEGKGVFTSQMIPKKRKICFLNGEKITLDEVIGRINCGTERAGDFLQINFKEYLSLQPPYLYFNHSCSPNSAIRGENELFSIRDIDAFEEITFDYSTTMFEDKEFISSRYGREAWTLRCYCKSLECRHLIDQFYLLSQESQTFYLLQGMVPDFVSALTEEKNKRLINPKTEIE